MTSLFILAPARTQLGYYRGLVLEFPDVGDRESSRRRPAQSLPILPCMRQPRPGAFSQDLPFELSEDGEQAGQGTSGLGGQVSRQTVIRAQKRAAGTQRLTGIMSRHAILRKIPGSLQVPA